MALFGDRGDAKADEILCGLRFVAEPKVMCGRRFHLYDAVRKFKPQSERASLVDDAGVAQVDRIRGKADAGFAQIARPADELFVRKDQVALGLGQCVCSGQFRVESRIEAAFPPGLFHLK